MFVKYLATNAFKPRKNSKATNELAYSQLAELVENEEKLEFLSHIIPKKITVKEVIELQNEESDSDDEEEEEEEEEGEEEEEEAEAEEEDEKEKDIGDKPKVKPNKKDTSSPNKGNLSSSSAQNITSLKNTSADDTIEISDSD